MTRLLATAVLALLIAANPSPAASADEPILGTLEVDPVLLLRDGKEVSGRKDLAVEHANFRYLFSTPEARDAFRKDPASFEIRLGGACGRMGSLSGTGKTGIFTVHEGGLYIFASESCRKTFLADPAKVLEPDVEPEAEVNEEDRARGAELIDKAVEWLGGAAAVDGAIVRVHREQVQEFEGEDHRKVTTIIMPPGGRYRSDSTWDDECWAQVLDTDAAFFIDPRTGTRTMRPVQRRSLERHLRRNIVPLLQARGSEGFSAAAVEGAAPARVRVRMDGVHHLLAIDPSSGRILSHEFLGQGPGIRYGRIEKTFTRWKTSKGVRLPVAWEKKFDGKDLDPVDLEADGYEIGIVDEVPGGTFDRPR